jgi:hypothetical protein
VRAWLLSSVLALGPAADGPSRISLDVSGLEQHMSDEALHRFHAELLLRLIEAGHGVGSEGDVQLSLASAGSTILVACEVEGRHESIEVDDADAAILSLELVHRAVDLVERCTAIAPGSGAGIVIDSDGSIEMAELVVEIADAPISVVTDAEHARWRLCVRAREAFVVEIDDPCELAADLQADEPRAAIERWQSSLAQVVEVPEPSIEPEPAIEPEPQPKPEPPAHVAPGKRRARWGLSANAAAGVRLRLPGAGATVSADLGALHESGVLIGVVGSLSPARAEQLRVIDALALASVGFRGRVSDRVVLRPSLGVGVAIHRYAYADEPVGHRIDFAIRVPLELQIRLTAHLYLSLAIAGTARTHRVEHLVGGTTVHTHGLIQLDALAGLRFDWPAR